MQQYNRQLLDNKLLLIEQLISEIRTGVGLTANTPDVAGLFCNSTVKSKPLPKSEKAMLKRKNAQELATALGDMSILHYIKF
jgi:hypothetical protein